MKRIKLNEVVFKEEQLKNYAKLLLKNGFRVFISENKESWDKTSYLHFSKDDKLGYVQTDYFSGLRFSTTHKPSRECGTGYGLQSEGLANPLIKNAEEAINTIKPRWADSSDKPIKYSGVDDYFNNTMQKILTYFEVVLE
jgi:hypothetical protein